MTTTEETETPEQTEAWWAQLMAITDTSSKLDAARVAMKWRRSHLKLQGVTPLPVGIFARLAPEPAPAYSVHAAMGVLADHLRAHGATRHGVSAWRAELVWALASAVRKSGPNDADIGDLIFKLATTEILISSLPEDT